MEKEHSPCYVFNTHVEAEEAIQSLNRSGFDVKKLSLVGKGYHSEEHPVGFYTVGDKIKTWGGIGAFWGAGLSPAHIHPRRQRKHPACHSAARRTVLAQRGEFEGSEAQA